MHVLKWATVGLLVLLPGATVGQGLLTGMQEMPSTPALNDETVYVLDPPADIREEALENMRVHLGDVENILAGIAEEDLAKVSQAARHSGQAYMAEHGAMGMWAMSHGYPWMNY